MRQRERTVRLGVAAAVVVLLAVPTLSGCASSDGPGRRTTPASAPATAPTSAATAPTSSATASTGSTGQDDGEPGHDPAGGPDGGSGGGPSTDPPTKNVIEWILGLGVDAPSGPTGHKDDMYAALGQQRCANVDEEFPVLHAAAAACLAAAGAGGTAGGWSEATQVRDATDPATLDCLDAAAYRVLDALVDAHQAHPDLPFELRGSDGTSRSTCLVASSVSPAQGTSGDLVTVRGRNLDRASSVELEDATAADGTARIVGRSKTRLDLRLPTGIRRSGNNLRIIWQQPTGPSATWVPFTYEPAQPDDDSTTTGGAAPTAGGDPTAGDPTAGDPTAEQDGSTTEPEGPSAPGSAPGWATAAPDAAPGSDAGSSGR